MKQDRRYTGLGLAVLLSGTLLGGCGSDDEGPQPQVGGQQATCVGGAANHTRSAHFVFVQKPAEVDPERIETIPQSVEKMEIEVDEWSETIFGETTTDKRLGNYSYLVVLFDQNRVIFHTKKGLHTAYEIEEIGKNEKNVSYRIKYDSEQEEKMLEESPMVEEVCNIDTDMTLQRGLQSDRIKVSINYKIGLRVRAGGLRQPFGPSGGGGGRYFPGEFD